jgi:hypothetical protein
MRLTSLTDYPIFHRLSRRSPWNCKGLGFHLTYGIGGDSLFLHIVQLPTKSRLHRFEPRLDTGVKYALESPQTLGSVGELLEIAITLELISLFQIWIKMATHEV